MTTALDRIHTRQERKRRRQIEGYISTASRILADLDRKRGVRMKWGDLWLSYMDDPALRGSVQLACTQVAAIHVPRRAVKLYCQAADGQGGAA